MGLNGLISKEFQKISLEQFMICLLNNTANPAQFGWKLDEFGVFIRAVTAGQAPKGQDLGLAWILQIKIRQRPCLPKIGRGGPVFNRQILNGSHNFFFSS